MHANSIRGIIALASLANFTLPDMRERLEHPHQMWRRGLMPRKWRSTRCMCRPCKVARGEVLP